MLDVYILMQTRFSSGIGLVLTCLGSTVGTGNIWRYPRIVAIHAAGGGMYNCIYLPFISSLTHLYSSYVV